VEEHKKHFFADDDRARENKTFGKVLNFQLSVRTKSDVNAK
jgi:hypothetical protein